MKIATKNFQLNSLANQYAASVLEHVRSKNKGDWFEVPAGHSTLRIEIIDGVKGVRQLIDGYLLEALEQNLDKWERFGIAILKKCLKNKSGLTSYGIEIWESMGNDIGSTYAGKEGKTL